ncbi:hypothetical protein QHH03_31485, partial [Aphanizomenon sp. 202]|nr:hypothetical protein [Aphanizomenon sp. 202]
GLQQWSEMHLYIREILALILEEAFAKTITNSLLCFEGDLSLFDIVIAFSKPLCCAVGRAALF